MPSSPVGFRRRFQKELRFTETLLCDVEKEPGITHGGSNAPRMRRPSGTRPVPTSRTLYRTITWPQAPYSPPHKNTRTLLTVNFVQLSLEVSPPTQIHSLTHAHTHTRTHTLTWTAPGPTRPLQWRPWAPGPWPGSAGIRSSSRRRDRCQWWAAPPGAGTRSWAGPGSEGRPSHRRAAGADPYPRSAVRENRDHTPVPIPAQKAWHTRPDEPAHPTHPTHPARPTRPVFPVCLARPSLRAHPARSARPAHPAHPARPSRVSTTRRTSLYPQNLYSLSILPTQHIMPTQPAQPTHDVCPPPGKQVCIHRSRQ